MNGPVGGLAVVARAVRAGEACLMVGFPVFAGALAVPPDAPVPAPALIATLLAAVPISLSIYAHNGLAGFDADRLDPKFRSNPLHSGQVTRRTLWAVAVLGALSGFGILAFAAPRALPLTIALWALWLAYSHPRGVKNRPGLATALHVAAGALIFAIPYSAQRPIDARGAVMALFFGFALASGHANHEAIDEPVDRAAGTRTLAVVAGRRTALRLNVVLAATAYAVLAAGAFFGLVERAVWVPFLVAGAVHLAAGLAVLSREATTTRLKRYRAVYRLIFLAAALTAIVLRSAGVFRGAA